MFQKILVAMDLSQSSLNALDTAAALAKRNNAELRLLYVDDQFVPQDPASSANDTTTSEILHALSATLQQRENIRCSVQTTKNFVSAGIVTISNEWKADMIVMGCHGASGYRRLFIGSNTYTVIKNASCPVLSIPSTKKWTEFRKVLFPVRPIPGALQKYTFLRNVMPKSSQLEILGLSVNKGEDDTLLVADMVRDLTNQFSTDDTRFSASVSYGNNIAEDVLLKCTLSKADLLVISPSLDISRNNYFVGPHSQQIINHSRVPVLHLRKAGLNEPRIENFESERCENGRC